MLRLRKNCLTLVAVLAALLVLDRALTPRDARRSELAGLRAQALRLNHKPLADVLVLGSSTIGQWLTPKELARILDVEPKTVLDGHLSACYANCSFSVTEKLSAQGRKFREVFLGVNLFSMCEGGSASRVMQNIELTPVAKLPKVLSLYTYSPETVTQLGRAAAMLASHTYRDPSYQQRRLAIWAFGKQNEPNLWRYSEATTQTKRLGSLKRCAYAPEEVALQLQFLDEQLTTLSQMSEHIYLLSLPERSLAHVRKEPQLRAAWGKHRQALTRIAQKHPKVTELDMTAGGIAKERVFRDVVHLNQRGIRHQSKRLRQLLRARAGKRR